MQVIIIIIINNKLIIIFIKIKKCLGILSFINDNLSFRRIKFLFLSQF